MTSECPPVMLPTVFGKDRRAEEMFGGHHHPRHDAALLVELSPETQLEAEVSAH